MLGRRLINTGAVACTTDTVQILDARTTESLALYRFEDDVNDTANSTGKFGKGAVFNGTNSYITTNLYLGSNWNSIPWSISFWAKADVAGDDFAFGTGAATGWAISFRNTSPRYVYMISGTNCAITYTVGEWKHFVYTFNGSNSIKGYGNSILEDTQAPHSSFGSTSPITMGRYGTVSSGYFDGQIDQIRFFNKELSQNEIDTVYAETASTLNTLQILGDTSCVAAYTFEGNANDLSTNYNGTASNVVYDYSGTASNITYGTGKFGKAAAFNPSNTSHINIDNLDFPTNNFTVSVWVYLNSVSASSGYDMILTTAKQNSGGYFYFTFSHNILYYYETGAGAAVSANTTVVSNQWYHVVLTKSSTSGVKLYLNNVVVGSNSGYTSNNTPNTTSGGVNTIGWYNTGSSTTASFDGLMDQFRIFDKALSVPEINILYNETTTSAASATIDNPSTLAYYKMDDATDETGYYNGTSANVDFNVEGKYGFAGKFNGSNSKIALNKTPFINLKNNFSYSLWFNSSVTSMGTLFSHLGNNTPKYGVFLNHSSDTSQSIRFFYSKGSNSQGTQSSSTNIWNVGQWHHLVITKSSTDGLKGYLDNTQIITDATLTDDLTPYTSQNGNSNIGIYQYLTSGGELYAFNGKIDQVRIFNKAISATEVTKLYNEIQCANPITAPEDYFNTKLYTGTGSSSNTDFTGVGFDPNFIWIKNRSSSGENHAAVDTVRGQGAILYPNLNLVESGANYITPITDGFRINTGNNNILNNNYVSWNWKAGSSNVTNNDGTLTSTVSASPESGFSIVRYTGTSNYSDTLGHGLTKAPKLVLQKAISSTSDWYPLIDLTENGTWDWAKLNTNQAFSPDSPTRFSANSKTINNWGWTNYDMINYCFHDVPGYQRIGTYVGNGETTGPYIYTGFEPAWIMIKRTDAAGAYNIFDNKRNSTNPRNSILQANVSDLEYTNTNYNFNFYTNGFQALNSNADWNASGGSYMFIAIAANPDTTAPTKANSFKTILYNGTGGSQTITGAGFKPDLAWIKSRSHATSHEWHDSVRGEPSRISSDLTSAESTSLNGFVSLVDGGFSVDGTGGGGEVNTSGRTYAAWLWKALDHDRSLPAINNNGQVPAAVSANPAAGFSILQWVSDGSSSISTKGHGLNAAPEMFIAFSRTHGSIWMVYHKDLPLNRYIYLNGSDALSNVGATYYSSTANTIGFRDGSNSASGQNMIAYCWHSVDGYSKVGSYTGQTAGVTITTGFRPAFIMIKSSSNVEHWAILDTERGTGKVLNANRNNEESDSTLNTFTVSDTGFSFPHQDTADAMLNENGYEYIYLAIA